MVPFERAPLKGAQTPYRGRGLRNEKNDLGPCHIAGARVALAFGFARIGGFWPYITKITQALIVTIAWPTSALSPLTERGAEKRGLRPRSTDG